MKTTHLASQQRERERVVFAHKFRRGAAVLTAVVFFLIMSLVIIFAAAPLALGESQEVRDLVGSKRAYTLAEGGAEDVVYRLKRGFPISAKESIAIASSTVSVAISDAVDGVREVSSAGVDPLTSTHRTVKVVVNPSQDVSFHFGIQVGQGGFTLQNSSSVIGSVFSNGPIVGSGNTIYGDVISGGTTGLISGVHATGSAYAHTITSSTIDKNAYYQTISGSTVAGVSYPGSTDLPVGSLPIDDETIEEWKAEALEGGVISSPCTYVISSPTTLGPKKVNCDLEVRNTTLTLSGVVWVNGNIKIKGSTVKIATAQTDRAIALIADNPTNRTTSSKITIETTSTFVGNGSLNSNVSLISQNSSKEQGGTERAIDLLQSAQGDLLLYAGHGEVTLGNSSDLHEITAYAIRISNNASITYKSGLANVNFTSGPGGGFGIASWLEQ